MLKFISKNSVCIYQPYPGLGDHLQHSTLPELFHSKGKKVYVSNKCSYRNNEIKELVWKGNPYVCGFSDLEPTAGLGCMAVQQKAIKIWKPTVTSLNNIEASHGFYSERPRPKIYYKPKEISHLKDFLVVDASACTCYDAYKKSLILSMVKSITSSVLFIKSKKVKYKEHEDLSSDEFETFYVDSIFNYCDAISSCKYFVSLMSGGHSLAQAFRDKETFCIIPQNLYNEHEKRGLFLNEPLVTYLKF